MKGNASAFRGLSDGHPKDGRRVHNFRVRCMEISSPSGVGPLFMDRQGVLISRLASWLIYTLDVVAVTVKTLQTAFCCSVPECTRCSTWNFMNGSFPGSLNKLIQLFADHSCITAVWRPGHHAARPSAILSGFQGARGPSPYDYCSIRRPTAVFISSDCL